MSWSKQPAPALMTVLWVSICNRTRKMQSMFVLKMVKTCNLQVNLFAFDRSATLSVCVCVCLSSSPPFVDKSNTRKMCLFSYKTIGNDLEPIFHSSSLHLSLSLLKAHWTWAADKRADKCDVFFWDRVAPTRVAVVLDPCRRRIRNIPQGKKANLNLSFYLATLFESLALYWWNVFLLNPAQTTARVLHNRPLLLFRSFRFMHSIVSRCTQWSVAHTQSPTNHSVLNHNRWYSTFLSWVQSDLCWYQKQSVGWSETKN